MKTRTIVLALLTSTLAGAHAGDLNVVGNINVASNLAASTMTLGGMTLSNWPSGGTATGAVVLTTGVLDFTQPGQFFQYTLTSDTTWVFTNHVAGRQVWLQVAQDATGGWHNTWPTTLLWSTGQPASVTTTPNHFSVITIFDTGSSWLAQAQGLDYSVPCTVNCNYAVQFDGSQNYVAVPATDAFSPSVFTVECWVLIPTGRYNEGRFLGNFTGSSGWLFNFNNVNSNNGIPLFIGVFNGGGQYVVGASDLRDGSWHHLAATYDGTALRLWVDGVPQSESDFTDTLTFSPGDLTFGVQPDHNFAYAPPMTLDEVRISNSVRYTTDFSNALPTCFTNDNNTVGYWQFNEGTGTTAHDSSSNSHDGTLQGSPVPTWVSGVACGGSQQMSVGARLGGAQSTTLGRASSQISGRSMTASQATLTNSPAAGSSVTITDTLGRVWGLMH